MDYQIQPNSRRCAVTGRELKAGERFFSALIERDHEFVREDYAADAWGGPPKGTYGFWAGRVPEANQAQSFRFDDDALESAFDSLGDSADPEKIRFRYVVALLLIRRRRYKLDGAYLDAGVEKMVLFHVRTGEKHEVVNPGLADAEIARVQDDVFRVLGWKQS